MIHTWEAGEILFYDVERLTNWAAEWSWIHYTRRNVAWLQSDRVDFVSVFGFKYFDGWWWWTCLSLGHPNNDWRGEGALIYEVSDKLYHADEWSARLVCPCSSAPVDEKRHSCSHYLMNIKQCVWCMCLCVHMQTDCKTNWVNLLLLSELCTSSSLPTSAQPHTVLNHVHTCIYTHILPAVVWADAALSCFIASSQTPSPSLVAKTPRCHGHWYE